MRSAALLMLIFILGCESRNETAGAPPQQMIAPTTVGAPDISGNWGGNGLSGTFDRVQISFHGGSFGMSRLYKGLSLGGSPALILFYYGGNYVQNGKTINLTFLYPECLKGSSQEIIVVDQFEKSRLTMDFGSGSLDFFSIPDGPIEHEGAIKTSNCRYAKINQKEDRRPASTTK